MLRSAVSRLSSRPQTRIAPVTSSATSVPSSIRSTQVISRMPARSLSSAAHGHASSHPAKKYPSPPVGDTQYAEDGYFRHNVEDSILCSDEFDFTPNYDEGLCVLKFTAGPYTGEEIVLAHMVPTLEWALPSPPPTHCFDESPILKRHPTEEEELAAIMRRGEIPAAPADFEAYMNELQRKALEVNIKEMPEELRAQLSPEDAALLSNFNQEGTSNKH